MAGCCTFPHGVLSIYSLICAIIAFVVTANTVQGCWYLKIDGSLAPLPPDYYTTNTAVQYTGVGLLTFEYRNVGSVQGYGYCYEYTDYMVNNFLDGPMLAARGFGYTVYVLTAICMIFLIVTSCLEFSVIALKGVGFLMIMSSILTMLTFVAFASKFTSAPYNGRFYVGPGLAIAASFFSFITGLICCKLPAAKRTETASPAQAYQPGTVTVTETMMPDGTKKIVKTTVNPDGSQTVEETIERPA